MLVYSQFTTCERIPPCSFGQVGHELNRQQDCNTLSHSVREMPNPYLTPEAQIGMPQVPAEELVQVPARFVWWKFFAVVFIGSLVSAIVIWWPKFSTGGLYGGKSVNLSYFGNCLFLALGAFLGMIGGMLPGTVFLSISDSSRGNGVRTWVISLLVSAILSPMIAVFMVTLLSILFFTMPDEWFRALYDVSDAIAK